MREIIASEEDKFWKIISRNTNLSQDLLNLDERLLTNYYKSNGYYNVEVNSKTAKINEAETKPHIQLMKVKIYN